MIELNIPAATLEEQEEFLLLKMVMSKCDSINLSLRIAPAIPIPTMAILSLLNLPSSF